MNILTRFVCACLIVILTGLLAARHFNTDQQKVLNSAIQIPVNREREPTLDEKALHTSLQATLNANPQLTMSISVIDLQTSKAYHYGEGATYTAASITKLLTAISYLHKVETGSVTLNQQIAEISAQTQLEKLIVDSDNVAWHILNDILTRPALQEYAKSIGITSYNITGNTITSNDVALLLAKLASGKLLNNANTKLLLGYMQRASMQAYIVAGAPEGAVVYHKTGYLSDRFHDGAIIRKGSRSFVLVIFSKTVGDYDFSKGARVFKILTTAAAHVFFGAHQQE